MTKGSDIFVRAGEGMWETTPEGNRRRILVHTAELMMVEFAFEKGSEGWLHSHPHVQSSYIAEGTFDVTVDGQTEHLNAGDCFIVPSGPQHGVRRYKAVVGSTASLHAEKTSSPNSDLR